MSQSIEEYSERQSKRRLRRKVYKIVPARIARRVPKIERVGAVIWDVYGTLMALSVGDLESTLAKKKTLSGAFRRTIREFGLYEVLDGDPPETLMDLYIGEIKKTHRRKHARGEFSPEVKIERIWLRILKKLEAKGYRPIADGKEIGLDLALRVAYFFDDVYQTKALYPGAQETLEGVRRLGLRQGIISNAQFYTPIALNMLGVSKPNPLAFERAKVRLHAMGIEPDRVLYVGNDVLNDMLAARAAGFRGVLFAGDRESLNLRKDRPECAVFRPDAVIKSLPQLLEIID